MTAADWGARRRACGLLAALLTATGGAPAQPAAVQARIEATVEGFGNLAPRGTDKPIAVTLHIGREAVRADFHFDTPGPDVYLLKHDGQPRAWWISPQGRYMIPVNDATGPYRYDLRHPCDTVQGRCSPAPGEFIAGRLARGLHYADARRGPDGTTRGTLWIDSQTGLLLGYRGTVGNRGETRSLRVRQVSYEAPDPALLTLPGHLNIPKGMDH